MPQLKQSDVRFPLNGRLARMVRGRIDRMASRQAVAATATDTLVSGLAGAVQSISVTIGAVPGTGESLVVDVQRNGVSLLGAPKTLNAAGGKGQFVLNPAANANVAIGDILTVIRTYVAGGAPALTASLVEIEVA